MPAEPRKRASTRVTTRSTSARPAASADVRETPAGPRLGTVGSGDLEVRERRAKRTATDALVDAYEQEYTALLRQARAAEGLRPLADPPPADL